MASASAAGITIFEVIETLQPTILSGRVGWLSQQLNASFQSTRYQHLILGRDDDAFDVGKLFDQCHSIPRAEEEHTLRDRIRQHRLVAYQRDAAALARGLPEIRIEDVVIALAVFHEEALVIA